MNKSRRMRIARFAGLVALLLCTVTGMAESADGKATTLYASPGYQSERKGDPYFDVAVKNAIRKHFSDVWQAYTDYLKTNPALTDGKVELDWYIETTGRVSSPEVIYSDFGGGPLEEGIMKTLATWKFPPPPGGNRAYVTHIFNLKKE